MAEDPSTILASVPGLAPPPGVVPNFVNPYSLESIQIVSAVLCLALALLSTLLRMYTKLFIIKTYGWEDYLICFATLGLISYISLGFADLQYGAGVHQWNVPILKVLQFGRLGYIIEVLYPVIILPIKLSILLQYIRIFVPNHRSKTYYLVVSFIACNVAFFTASFLISVFQCTPIQRAWDPFLDGHCVNWDLAIVLTAVFNLVSDLCILLMPIAWIWRLQMSTGRKVGISAIFLLGIFACAITVVRLYWSIKNNGSKDSTFSLVAVALCTQVPLPCIAAQHLQNSQTHTKSSMGEITAGILVANLPITPRFFAHFGPRVSSKFTSSLHRLIPSTWSKPSTNGSIPKKPKTPWQDQERKARRLTDSYTELDGSTDGHRSGSIARSGTDDYTVSVEDVSMHKLADLERGFHRLGGNEKILRIQKPKPTY